MTNRSGRSYNQDRGNGTDLGAKLNSWIDAAEARQYERDRDGIEQIAPPADAEPSQQAAGMCYEPTDADYDIEERDERTYPE